MKDLINVPDSNSVTPTEFTTDGKSEFAVLRSQFPRGKESGPLTAGTWIKRELTHIVVTKRSSKHQPDGWVKLGNNSRVTLQPGTYFIRAQGVGYNVEHHKMRFRDVTNIRTAVIGMSNYSRSGHKSQQYDHTTALLIGMFAVEEEAQFELQHITLQSQASHAQGIIFDLSGEDTEENVYTVLEIVRIGSEST